MGKWVITYDGIDGKDILMNEYETIEGKNAMDALNKRLGRSFDDCFEMNDGEQVIQDILRRCKVDVRIAQEFISRQVFGPEVTEKLQQIVKESYEPQRIGGE